MTVIHVRKFDWYYAGESLGKSVLLRADGYPIEGYDMNDYTFEEAIEEYMKKNSIEDEIELEGVYDG